MLKIRQIIEQYHIQILQIEESNLRNLNVLKEGLDLSVNTLNKLRKRLRAKDCFLSQEEEIHFFKHSKPFINGRIKFFSKVRRFISKKPNLFSVLAYSILM